MKRVVQFWTQLKALWTCLKGHFELTEAQLDYAEEALKSLFEGKKKGG